MIHEYLMGRNGSGILTGAVPQGHKAWTPKGCGNKAGYTATSVACGWAGAVFELLKHLARSSEAKDRKNIKKVKWGPTDRPTDQPTDQPTNRLTDQPTDTASYRGALSHLKR